MYTNIPFRHDGVDYEVRCISDGYTIRVSAYRGDKPANGYEYSVTLPTSFDLKKIRGVDAAKLLIEDAKRDVVEGTWEKYLKAVEELEAAERERQSVARAKRP